MVTMMSASAAAIAGVSHHRAPRSTSAEARSGERFETFTSCPASSRWPHIDAPITPVPIQATRSDIGADPRGRAHRFRGGDHSGHPDQSDRGNHVILRICLGDHPLRGLEQRVDSSEGLARIAGLGIAADSACQRDPLGPPREIGGRSGTERRTHRGREVRADAGQASVDGPRLREARRLRRRGRATFDERRHRAAEDQGARRLVEARVCGDAQQQVDPGARAPVGDVRGEDDALVEGRPPAPSQPPRLPETRPVNGRLARVSAYLATAMGAALGGGPPADLARGAQGISLARAVCRDPAPGDAGEALARIDALLEAAQRMIAEADADDDVIPTIGLIGVAGVIAATEPVGAAARIGANA